ncbi:MAG: LytTR family transcriptional regulator [Xanthomonadales bacterium]|nr:LytTR family transcriptional regulator [Xanthomonadales bacterium]
MTLSHYLSHRRYYEVALWAALLGFNMSANAWVSTLDAQRVGLEVAWWAPLTWEFSSMLFTAALLPLMLAFDRRFPLEPPLLRRHLPLHLLFTLPYSLIHVAGMYWARRAFYAWMGDDYLWPNWWAEFGYEYLKDCRGYFSLIALIYLYRFLLLRWQGQAAFVAEGTEESVQQPASDRFLVKKLGREFLVRVEDIDWLEAAGNYVNLHVGTRIYPLRETMGSIESRLEGRGFARVHRSAIVNLDRVREIVPFDSGDGEARLTTDQRIPVSRRYRKALREQLAS